MKILIILLVFPSLCLSQQWIDPHDMNVNSKHYLKKSVSKGDSRTRAEECNVNVEESNSLIYLKRFVNLLLNSAEMSKNNMLEYKGHIDFTVSEESFKFLKSFSALENVNVDDLRKLDTILSKSLEHTYLDHVAYVFMSAQEKFQQLLFSPKGFPLLALIICFPYVGYNLFKSNFSIWYVFRYLILMIFMIDFIQRYQQLLEDAEQHNMDLEYSSKCDTSKMSWGEYFKFLSSHEDCEKRVVSLLEVALNQLKNVIIVPLSAVGTGMGQFGSELWKNLPFPWNILIFPIMLIFCAILAAIIMTTVNNTPFTFNIMHIFHLEFGEKKTGIAGKTLDKLLDAVTHRPFLQDVKSGKGKTPPKKNAPKQIKNEKPNGQNETKNEKNQKKKSQQEVKAVEKPDCKKVDAVERKDKDAECKTNAFPGNNS